MSTTVRGMTAADLPAVHAVEAVAGERFRSVTDLRIAGRADWEHHVPTRPGRRTMKLRDDAHAERVVGPYAFGSEPIGRP